MQGSIGNIFSGILTTFGLVNYQESATGQNNKVTNSHEGENYQLTQSELDNIKDIVASARDNNSLQNNLLTVFSIAESSKGKEVANTLRLNVDQQDDVAIVSVSLCGSEIQEFKFDGTFVVNDQLFDEMLDDKGEVNVLQFQRKPDLNILEHVVDKMVDPTIWDQMKSSHEASMKPVEESAIDLIGLDFSRSLLWFPKATAENGPNTLTREGQIELISQQFNETHTVNNDGSVKFNGNADVFKILFNKLPFKDQALLLIASNQAYMSPISGLVSLIKAEGMGSALTDDQVNSTYSFKILSSSDTKVQILVSSYYPLVSCLDAGNPKTIVAHQDVSAVYTVTSDTGQLVGAGVELNFKHLDLTIHNVDGSIPKQQFMIFDGEQKLHSHSVINQHLDHREYSTSWIPPDVEYLS